jgi:hypothetical protein
MVRYTRAVSRQRLGKHIPAKQTQRPLLGSSWTTTMGELCFLRGACREVISGAILELTQHPCGGGVEYLHRDPASRRRRRKGKSQIWDSVIRSQVPRDYDRERLRWQGPAAHTKDRSVLSSERASHGIKNVNVRRIPYSERKKNLVVSPGWVLYTKIDWPTDRRS